MSVENRAQKIKRIATLGPQGTYSEQATKKYIDTISNASEIHYYSSISKALHSIGSDSDVGVLPIENLSEGFISVVLDQIIESDLFIIGEVILSINFSLVSNCAIDEIEKLYVQFVAKGQCSDCIDSLENITISTTESNIESLDLVMACDQKSAAIVPSESFSHDLFQSTIDNVNNYKNNQTRFFAFSSEYEVPELEDGTEYKTSIVILDDNDQPGLLSKILASFAAKDINLTSIISRPTREALGKYHFFIDFDGHICQKDVAEALAEINAINKLKVLGSYKKAVC